MLWGTNLEIELPDGTVLEAPEGSDPKKVVRGYRLAQLKKANPGEYDSSSKEFQKKYGPVGAGPDRYITGDDSDATMREGIGSGIVRATRGLGNLENKALNMHPLVKLFGGIDLPGKEKIWGDQAIRTQDELDSPLARTTKGAVGQAIGQGATAAFATAPLGGLGAFGTGGGVLARTLANPLTRQALEGATAGAAAADPDHQGEGAEKGAAASVIIGKFLQGAGRAVRGLVKKNEAVRDLETELGSNDLDIPLAQAASDEDMISRGVRAMYQEGLPNVLGVKGRIARQSREAEQRVRGMSQSHLGDTLADEVFAEPAARGSKTARILTSLGLGGSLVYGSPIPPAVVLLGGNAMATKTVQRALLGDTAAQRRIAEVVEKYPNVRESMSRLIMDTGASRAGE